MKLDASIPHRLSLCHLHPNQPPHRQPLNPSTAYCLVVLLASWFHLSTQPVSSSYSMPLISSTLLPLKTKVPPFSPLNPLTQPTSPMNSPKSTAPSTNCTLTLPSVLISFKNKASKLFFCQSFSAILPEAAPSTVDLFLLYVLIYAF